LTSSRAPSEVMTTGALYFTQSSRSCSSLSFDLCTIWLTANGAEGDSGWARSHADNSSVMRASHSSSIEIGRAFSDGKDPMMPALHCASTSSGASMMNSGDPITGTLSFLVNAPLSAMAFFLQLLMRNRCRARARAAEGEAHGLEVEVLDRDARGQASGEMQHDHAMGGRPKRIADQPRLAMDDPGGNEVLHMPRHRLARAFSGAAQFGMARLIRRIEVEHQPVGMGILAREVEIGAPDGAGPREGVFAGGEGALQRVGKAVEGFGADEGEDLLAIGEVAVETHRAAPELLGDVAHGDGADAAGRVERRRRCADSGADRFEVFRGQLSGHHVSYRVRVQCIGYPSESIAAPPVNSFSPPAKPGVPSAGMSMTLRHLLFFSAAAAGGIVFAANAFAAVETVVVAASPPDPVGNDAFSVVRLGTDDIRSSAELDRSLSQVPGLSLFRRDSSLSANPTTQGLSLRSIAPSGAGRA